VKDEMPKNSEAPIRLEWRIRASVLPTYGAASTGRQEYKGYKIKWQWDETGIFGIGVSNPKTTQNSGTLWRSVPHCGTDVIEKVVEGKFVLGDGREEEQNPGSSHQNRGMLGRPSSPVERSTTTSEGKYRGKKTIIQKNVFDRIIKKHNVTLLIGLWYTYSPCPADVL